MDIKPVPVSNIADSFFHIKRGVLSNNSLSVFTNTFSEPSSGYAQEADIYSLLKDASTKKRARVCVMDSGNNLMEFNVSSAPYSLEKQTLAVVSLSNLRAQSKKKFDLNSKLEVRVDGGKYIAMPIGIYERLFDLLYGFFAVFYAKIDPQDLIRELEYFEFDGGTLFEDGYYATMLTHFTDANYDPEDPVNIDEPFDVYGSPENPLKVPSNPIVNVSFEHTTHSEDVSGWFIVTYKTFNSLGNIGTETMRLKVNNPTKLSFLK